MITPRGTKYEIRAVMQDIDPVTKEECGGDAYTHSTETTKAKAHAVAKKLSRSCYEAHAYRETDGTITGHWIFKKGKLTENMFNN